MFIQKPEVEPIINKSNPIQFNKQTESRLKLMSGNGSVFVSTLVNSVFLEF